MTDLPLPSPLPIPLRSCNTRWMTETKHETSTCVNINNAAVQFVSASHSLLILRKHDSTKFGTVTESFQTKQCLLYFHTFMDRAISGA